MEERDPLWILCSLPLGTVPPAFWPVVGSASVCALAESIADLTRVFYYWVGSMYLVGMTVTSIPGALYHPSEALERPTDSLTLLWLS